MPRYNIAFIPTRRGKQFIRYAHSLSNAAPAYNYLIDGEHSLPHISLCHFETDIEHVGEIWQKIVALAMPTVHIAFHHQRTKSYSDRPDLCWVSLIPDCLTALKDYHLLVAEIIKTPLNAAFDQFDPHMTLFNSLAGSACAVFNQKPRLISAIEDHFVVMLGTLDSAGQIKDILYGDLCSGSSPLPL